MVAVADALIFAAAAAAVVVEVVKTAALEVEAVEVDWTSRVEASTLEVEDAREALVLAARVVVAWRAAAVVDVEVGMGATPTFTRRGGIVLDRSYRYCSLHDRNSPRSITNVVDGLVPEGTPHSFAPAGHCTVGKECTGEVVSERELYWPSRPHIYY